MRPSPAGASGRLRHTRNALVAVAIPGLLVGCGSGSDTAATSESEPPAASFSQPTPTAPATSGPAPAVPAPPAVPEILQFTATTVDGASFDGASLAGTNAVLWFWAPWCPICKAAGGDVAALASTLGDRARVVGVGGLSGNADDMRSFVDDSGTASLLHVADTDGAVFTRFGVTQQDTFVLISAAGDVRAVEAYGADPDIEAIAREHFRL